MWLYHASSQCDKFAANNQQTPATNIIKYRDRFNDVNKKQGIQFSLRIFSRLGSFVSIENFAYLSQLARWETLLCCGHAACLWYGHAACAPIGIRALVVRSAAYFGTKPRLCFHCAAMLIHRNGSSPPLTFPPTTHPPPYPEDKTQGDGGQK